MMIAFVVALSTAVNLFISWVVPRHEFEVEMALIRDRMKENNLTGRALQYCDLSEDTLAGYKLCVHKAETSEDMRYNN